MKYIKIREEKREKMHEKSGGKKGRKLPMEKVGETRYIL